MKILCTKRGGSLVPVDEIGEDALRKLKADDIVSVEIKKQRHPGRHRLYWSLVSLVWRNQDRYETREQVHNALKLSCGVYTMIELPNGVRYKVPGTISFDSMSDIEFAQYFDRVCDAVATHYLPGVEIPELREQVESMIGARAA